MSASRMRLQEPARFGDYELRVDDVSHPGRLILLCAQVEIASLAYVYDADELVERLVEESGCPASTAKALVTQLLMKIASAGLELARAS